MDAKIVPEIELKGDDLHCNFRDSLSPYNVDIESNIQKISFRCKINFRCPICIEDFGEEKLTYNNQCDSGKHYLCNDCNEKYIKSCNENRKDHICVICKKLIKTYEEEKKDDIEEMNHIDHIHDIRMRIMVQNSINQNNESLPFSVKLLLFDFVFIVITLIIMGNINVSKQIKNSIYVIYGFLLFTTLLFCCVSHQSHTRILP